MSAEPRADRLDWAKSYLKTFAVCPLCSGTDWWPLYELGVLKIRRCRGCGLKFLNPCLMPEEQKMIFSSTEMLLKVSEFFSDYHDDSSWTTPKTAAIFKSTLEHLEKLMPSKGKILDVGCGKGAFLIKAQERGWEAYGLEPNFDAAAKLKQGHGIECRSDDFFTAAYPKESFQVICLWDLIEHTPEPLKWFERCRELLAPGGLLLIATPNHHSLLDGLAHMAFKLTCGKSQFMLKKLYTVDHTLYLTGGTLRELFKKAKFQTVKTLKVNTDLERYRMSPAFRAASEILLALSALTGLQNRVIMIGQKQA
jgi:2-polyprenyl-3-methyl-5-hydroxy-6-metoxy-1,4-benzoquinol methylase